MEDGEWMRLFDPPSSILYPPSSKKVPGFPDVPATDMGSAGPKASPKE